MESFLVSTATVAFAELGDKTQLLAFVLAARFQQRVPVLLGIVLATLLNHGLAGFFSVWLLQVLSPQFMRWALITLFFGMAVWSLIPDKLYAETATKATRWGVLGTTFVAFFIAEMGDKTQIATVALTAHYQQLLAVLAGTTLGMLIADGPAVLVGTKITGQRWLRIVRVCAALIFAILGVALLIRY